MSDYTDRVERGLSGLGAVSIGICPGCDECAGILGYGPARDPETDEETETHAEVMARFRADWERGRADGGSQFSWGECGICGSRLGGDRSYWHAIDGTSGRLWHFDDACTDCVMYIANGDEPGGDPS